eukprot:CAMPEP_0177550160 /NCGR_PEP_ID=MMETSP0369-20130122/65416_1 /TAXON_ID=447022 ORGANISM="Scrippsiella hangoei-like, Strain SHHI-4" /NCGR_SAMPLE_ID=MMETSP0369 /ASSEMBLY_ACC=CAM_ASM_000364 /LENGTH=141 /DNA_ID=CAMNT_0019035327 /DNA_START=175 /DNA_END=598 /DNA_ORIENTATION=-
MTSPNSRDLLHSRSSSEASSSSSPQPPSDEPPRPSSARLGRGAAELRIGATPILLGLGPGGLPRVQLLVAIEPRTSDLELVAAILLFGGAPPRLPSHHPLRTIVGLLRRRGRRLLAWATQLLDVAAPDDLRRHPRRRVVEA